MSDYVVYEERTTWSWWVMLVVVGSSLAAAVGVLLDAAGTPGAFVAVAVCALLPLALWFLFGTLVVRVTRTSVLVGFGPALLIQKLVPFSDIREVEAVTYRPLVEFGGWGIRFGFGGGKRAWTIRGNRAVVLYLYDGTRLYVGTEHPERLAERIRTASGGRVGEA